MFPVSEFPGPVRVFFGTLGTTCDPILSDGKITPHKTCVGAQGANENERIREKENGAHTAKAPAQTAVGQSAQAAGQQSDQQEDEEKEEEDENDENDEVQDIASEEDGEEEEEEDEEDWENQVFLCRGIGAGGDYDCAAKAFKSCHVPIYCKYDPFPSSPGIFLDLWLGSLCARQYALWMSWRSEYLSSTKIWSFSFF